MSGPAAPVLRDTREMPWQPHPGIPGGRWKVLARGADGTPLVMLNWLPPELAPQRAERHWHRTVLEHGLVLGGEMAIREYAGVADEHGRAVRFTEGYFYRRRPGSVHGLDPLASERPGIGFLILEWRTGPGTYLWELDMERETVVEALPEPGPVDDRSPADADEHGVVLHRDDVTILDSRAMAWKPHPGLPGTRVKVLAADAVGLPSALLAWIGPEIVGTSLGADQDARVGMQRGFVLEGEWTSGGAEPVALGKGAYYEPVRGARCGVAGGRTGVGAIVLEWRSDGSARRDDIGAGPMALVLGCL